MKKPLSDEYEPYFQRYIDLVEEGDFMVLLKKNTDSIHYFFSEIPSEKQNFRYQLEKWTIKEILMHIIDTERVFAYRALVCLRADKETRLCNMNENLYARNSNVSNRSMKSLIDEFLVVRKNTEFLFQNVSQEQSIWTSSGLHFTPRALAYILLGHPLHHFRIIKERYL